MTTITEKNLDMTCKYCGFQGPDVGYETQHWAGETELNGPVCRDIEACCQRQGK